MTKVRMKYIENCWFLSGMNGAFTFRVYVKRHPVFKAENNVKSFVMSFCLYIRHLSRLSF